MANLNVRIVALRKAYTITKADLFISAQTVAVSSELQQEQYLKAQRFRCLNGFLRLN